MCTALTALLLCACSDDTVRQGIQSVRLPPCSAEGSIFAEREPDEWKDIYHGSVSAVIEAHLKDANNVTSLKLECTAEDYAGLLPASDELRSVASMLPLWREDNRASRISEADMGPVLLEFLRVYECSMNEREEALIVRIQDELDRPLDFGELTVEMEKVKQEISSELSIARPSLERTLALVGGYDRLRPLSLDIECIKRASLDLRNVMGLAADASACLPRIWDAKGSLRDLAQ